MIGEPLKELICGGKDVSGATLGRFFSLHVIILPLLLLATVGYHLALISWKGISPKTTVTEEAELLERPTSLPAPEGAKNFGELIPNTEISLLMIWSFLAGFSESFVPRMLTQVEGATSAGGRSNG